MISEHVKWVIRLDLRNAGRGARRREGVSGLERARCRGLNDWGYVAAPQYHPSPLLLPSSHITYHPRPASKILPLYQLSPPAPHSCQLPHMHIQCAMRHALIRSRCVTGYEPQATAKVRAGNETREWRSGSSGICISAATVGAQNRVGPRG